MKFPSIAHARGNGIQAGRPASLPWLFALIVALLPAAMAYAQEYPSKTIRIIVGFPPGGITDIYARSLANQLQTRLKNPVVVENRPGGGGLVAADAIIKSAPDGYTLTHIVPSTVTKVFVKDPPFDVFKAMQAIASVWIGPLVMTTNIQVPATTLKEFIDFVKANPGKFNYGSTNGVNFMPMALFVSLAGLQMQPIEYKGAAQINAALLTNEIQAQFSSYQSVASVMGTGKLRPLAFTGNQRMSILPDVPTTSELGFPAMNLQTIGTIMAPAGVPAPIAARLHAAFREIVASPETEKMLRENGRPLNVSTDELLKMLREEIAAWEAAAKVAGFRPQ